MKSSKKNLWFIGSCVILLFAVLISDFGCPLTDLEDNANVIYFEDPIRIGDDQDYNANHDPDFQISTPTGLSYAESFTIAQDDLNSSKAVIRYTIAGAMLPAEVYLNGAFVGTTCTPGNSANAIRNCDDIDITGMLQTGNNELKIVTALVLEDNISPYDDIEIYNLRITLTR